MRRRLSVLAVGGLLAFVSAIYAGARAHAAYSFDKPTKRRVHVSLEVPEIAPATVVFRSDVDAPAKIVPSVPLEPPRIVRPKLDDVPDGPHPRLVHDDLDQATTFVVVGAPGESTARYVRTEL